MLAKSKLNRIETLVSQTLIDTEIIHEEFNTIIQEKQKYEKMKENVRNVNEKQENMILNRVNSRTKKIMLQMRKFVNLFKLNFEILWFLSLKEKQ